MYDAFYPILLEQIKRHIRVQHFFLLYLEIFQIVVKINFVKMAWWKVNADSVSCNLTEQRRLWQTKNAYTYYARRVALTRVTLSPSPPICERLTAAPALFADKAKHVGKSKRMICVMECASPEFAHELFNFSPSTLAWLGFVDDCCKICLHLPVCRKRRR